MLGSLFMTVLAGPKGRNERGRIEIDLDLARFPTEWIGSRGARHGDERYPHDVETGVSEGLFGQALARKRKLDDRNRGRVIV